MIYHCTNKNVYRFFSFKEILPTDTSYGSISLKNILKIAVIFAGNRKFNAIRLDY